MGNAFGMIPGLEPDEWSNDACRGYVIMAMENCGFSKKDIRRVVGQLYEVFDLNSVEDAKEKYLSSPYCPRATLTRSGESSKGGTCWVPAFDISQKRLSEQHQHCKWARPSQGHDPALNRLAACSSGLVALLALRAPHRK